MTEAKHSTKKSKPKKHPLHGLRGEIHIPQCTGAGGFENCFAHVTVATTDGHQKLEFKLTEEQIILLEKQLKA